MSGTKPGGVAPTNPPGGKPEDPASSRQRITEPLRGAPAPVLPAPKSAAPNEPSAAASKGSISDPDDARLDQILTGLAAAPPVEYAEKAESSGEEGVRFHAVGPVPSATPHATIPDQKVIIGRRRGAAIAETVITEPGRRSSHHRLLAVLGGAVVTAVVGMLLVLAFRPKPAPTEPLPVPSASLSVSAPKAPVPPSAPPTIDPPSAPSVVLPPLHSAASPKPTGPRSTASAPSSSAPVPPAVPTAPATSGRLPFIPIE